MAIFRKDVAAMPKDKTPQFPLTTADGDPVIKPLKRASTSFIPPSNSVERASTWKTAPLSRATSWRQSNIQHAITHHSTLLLLEKHGLPQVPRGYWDRKTVSETPPTRNERFRVVFEPESAVRQAENQIRRDIKQLKAEKDARSLEPGWLEGPALEMTSILQDMENVQTELRDAGRWENTYLSFRLIQYQNPKGTWFGKHEETEEEMRLRLEAETSVRGISALEWTREFEPQPQPQVFEVVSVSPETNKPTRRRSLFFLPKRDGTLGILRRNTILSSMSARSDILSSVMSGSDTPSSAISESDTPGSAISESDTPSSEISESDTPSSATPGSDTPSSAMSGRSETINSSMSGRSDTINSVALTTSSSRIRRESSMSTSTTRSTPRSSIMSMTRPSSLSSPISSTHSSPGMIISEENVWGVKGAPLGSPDIAESVPLPLSDDTEPLQLPPPVVPVPGSVEPKTSLPVVHESDDAEQMETLELSPVVAPEPDSTEPMETLELPPAPNSKEALETLQILPVVEPTPNSVEPMETLELSPALQPVSEPTEALEALQLSPEITPVSDSSEPIETLELPPTVTPVTDSKEEIETLELPPAVVPASNSVNPATDHVEPLELSPPVAPVSGSTESVVDAKIPELPIAVATPESESSGIIPDLKPVELTHITADVIDSVNVSESIESSSPTATVSESPKSAGDAEPLESSPDIPESEELRAITPVIDGVDNTKIVESLSADAPAPNDSELKIPPASGVPLFL